MTVQTYSCLLAFVLGCNVSADIIHRIISEKESVTLRCPLSAEDNVTWSRETDASKQQILLIDGDRDVRVVDEPYRHYSSLADKSLHIHRAGVQDAAKYFCNEEPAAELTVVSAGTPRLVAAEGTSVTLTCPPDAGGSGAPTWTRDVGGKVKGECLQRRRRFQVSTPNKTLTIRDVQPGDSGLYYCDGKPAAYLTVTEDEQPEEAPAHLWPVVLRLLVASLFSAVIMETVVLSVASVRMKMRLNVGSCLLAALLGCNVAAAIIPAIIEKKQPIALPCPRPVDGAVTWTRETNGQRVDLLTVDEDKEIKHIDDRLKRYSSLADKSLHIREVNTSDSGRYFCNNQTAADLTVIPSGTTRRVAERTTVALTCPRDAGGSTWSRDAGDIRHRGRFYVSTVDRTLTVRDVQPGDSGLYYCDGKPAAYLIVIKIETSERDDKSPPTPTSTPTTPTTRGQTAAAEPPPAETTAPLAPSANTDTTPTKTEGKKMPTTTTRATTPTPVAHTETPKDPQPPLGLRFGIAVPFLLLLLLLIIIVIYFTCRRRIKRQGVEEKYAVYDEIRDAVEILPTDDASNQNDPTYCTIPDPPPGEKTSD
ncbi:uncharacterized protein LOC143335302 [Chaetodon auriga]|uniref:uncharacterized protein LOC143335302 n=1 Tax=Chaetodon auriga TaxID=39042 RepID=UPI004032C9AF